MSHDWIRDAWEHYITLGERRMTEQDKNRKLYEEFTKMADQLIKDPVFQALSKRVNDALSGGKPAGSPASTWAASTDDVRNKGAGAGARAMRVGRPDDSDMIIEGDDLKFGVLEGTLYVTDADLPVATFAPGHWRSANYTDESK